jgi:hypothetical protein
MTLQALPSRSRSDDEEDAHNGDEYDDNDDNDSGDLYDEGAMLLNEGVRDDEESIKHPPFISSDFRWVVGGLVLVVALALTIRHGGGTTSDSRRCDASEVPQQTGLPSGYFGPPDLGYSVAECRSNCYMFTMGKSGMGSQIVNVFASKVYMREVYNRDQFFVDETRFNHYMFAGQRIMRAWFTPQIPIMEYTDQRPLVDAHLPPGLTMDSWYQADTRKFGDFANKGMVNATDMWLGELRTFHTAIVEHYKDDWDYLYKQLVIDMCPNLQFNQQALRAMNELRDLYHFPRDDQLRESSSVVFHVRRTDKLRKESALYPADDYVKKVQSVTKPGQVLEHCFLATDDDAVISEMKQALSKANMTCQLHTTPDLTPGVNAGSKKTRSDSDAALVFLMQVSLMIRADYFVGTFNSNVATMVAVLRACPGGYDSRKHYAHTYGVDGDQWYFR